MLSVLQPWIALHASDARAFTAFAAAAAGWGCGIAVAQVAREQVPLVAFFRVRGLTFAQCKGDGASAAAWAALSSRLPPAST